jgi:energy-converting hydrogenase Eha subunit G
MATQGARLRTGGATRGGGMLLRLTSETKHSLKTTEFWAMVAVIAGILVASWVVGQGEGNGNSSVDAFPAQRAWLYVAIVAVGYMVSRGLAKAGSRDPYWSDASDIPGMTDDADSSLGRAGD